ncbi:hypothetical protein ACH4MG_08475 [Streptomyces sp. NPDC017454]|uniref:hypothetical protein n=1 Tax=Streptomyces sp. NPDC017454 TaxID=3364997 RepID=UPI0037B10B90
MRMPPGYGTARPGRSAPGQQPSTDSARVVTPPGPTSVRVACQVHGGLVEYDGYGNDVRRACPDHGGCISDVFMDVNDARLPGVPTC